MVSTAGLLAGKVAFITGAARGQGRAHAEGMAREGADLLLVDVCDRVAPTGYPPATREELDATVAACEKYGVRVRADVVDVRDGPALRRVVDDAVDDLGRLDVIVANAGVAFFQPFLEMGDDDWDAMIATNLTGVQRTLSAAVPAMVRAGNGGSVILTSSVGGVKVIPFEAHYIAAKHGVVGLMRALAVELAEHGIRVNTINPGGVDTAMAHAGGMEAIFDNEQRAALFAASFNPMLPPYLLPPEEIAGFSVWLASEATRAVTGQTFLVDCGVTAR